MGNSFNSEINETCFSPPNKEYSNEGWQEHYTSAETLTGTTNKNSEQKENQIDYCLEGNSLLYNNGKITTDSKNTESMHAKPKNSVKLMLTDFPELNSENDESDSFKDFLSLEAEIAKGSPSPESIHSRRKNSVESEKDYSDIQIKDRTR